MFGKDSELGNILQEAVKLKSAQLGQRRKTYETWPFFVQHTLFHGEKDNFKAWRQLPFAEKMQVSERIKEEGNQLYAQGKWSDAVDKYEEAVTMFHYCYSTDPGWRKNNRGIDDDVLVLVDDKGSSEEEASQQIKLRVACCLNIAACKQKLGNHEEAIVACDVALELDPQSVKALYRRAESRIKPSGSTAHDQDLAIKDLAKAHQVDPTNQAVEKLLLRLRAERKVQRDKDLRTFTGMFHRGHMYKEELAGITAASPAGQAQGSADGKLPPSGEEDTLEQRVADAELLRDYYMRNGKEEEAKDLNEKIKMAKKAIRERDRNRVDWANPTPQMIEDARQHGLDLTDPEVIAELLRLEREGLGKDDVHGEQEDLHQKTPLVERPSSSKSSTKADNGSPVPWMRYITLIAVMVLAWRLLDSGVPRVAASGLLRAALRTLGLSSASLLGGSEDTGADDRQEMTFVAMYRALTSFFGGDTEELEL